MARKIGVSLPDELFRSLERARRRERKNRSSVIQEAVRRYLAEDKEAEEAAAYARAYAEEPEDPTEFEGLIELGIAALAAEPWEVGKKRK